MYIKGTVAILRDTETYCIHIPCPPPVFSRYACFWGLIVGALFGSISLAGLAAIQKGSKSPPCIVSWRTDDDVCQGFWVKGKSAEGMDVGFGIGENPTKVFRDMLRE